MIRGLWVLFFDDQNHPSVRSRSVVFSRRRALVLGAVLLFAVPAAVDLCSSPLAAPYRYLAADTFYYLTVARNWARLGSLSFDGAHASNGFHPLWQVWACITEWLRLRLHLGNCGPFLLTLSGLGLLSATAWLLGLSLLRARRLSVWFLALPVGVYAISVLPAWLTALPVLVAHQNLGWLLPVFGTLWSYMNGMESALVLFFYALTLFLALGPEATRSPRQAASVGLSLAGLTLARLDHGLFALALLFGYALTCQTEGRPRRAAWRTQLQRSWRRYRQPLIAGLVWTACVLPYLIYNKHTFGAYVPLSGVAKSTFPNFTTDNLDRILELTRGKLTRDSDWWLPTLCRQLQIVVPALFAGAYLILRAFRPARSRLTTLLSASALGVLALAAYDFSYAAAGDQGFWYMPVSTLLPTLFVLNARLPRLRGISGRVAAAVIGVGVLEFFAKWHRHPTYNHDFQGVMLHTGSEVRAHYAGHPPKILEIDDGVVGYALDTPAHPCFLALDPAGFKALKDKNLLDLVLARGFDHVASSFYHPYDFSSDSLTGWVGNTLHQDMTHFLVEKEYFSSDGLLLIAKITRR